MTNSPSRILEAARQKNMLYKADPETAGIDQTLLYLAWGVAAQDAPREAVPELLAQWQASTSGEVRSRLVRAMGMARDPAVLRDTVLPFCYGTAPADRVLKTTEMRPLVTWLAQRAPAGPLQWEYIKTNWDAIVAKVGMSDMMCRTLNASLFTFGDAAAVEDIDAFFADKDTNGIAITMARIKDGILNVDRFRKRERASLLAWLREKEYLKAQ